MDFLLNFIIHNQWNNVLVLTDYDTRALMGNLSSVFVKSKIIEMNSNASVSTLLATFMALVHGHQHVILWCNNRDYLKFVTSLQMLDIFGKRFTWLIVEDTLKGLGNVKFLETELGPSSHVYILAVPNSGQIQSKLVELRHVRFNLSNQMEVIPHNDLNARRVACEAPNLFPLRGYVCRIVTFHVPPYVLINNKTPKPIFTGYSIAILHLLSEYLGFKFELFIDKNKAFGGLKNGVWSGVVGTVYRNEADVGVVGIALTADRSEAVDFASYVLTTHVAVIIRRPPDTTSQWSFLLYEEPFALTVWLVCAITCLVVLICMVFAMTDLLFCNTQQQTRSEIHSLNSVMWLFICSVLKQDAANMPTRISNQTVFIVFAFFMILISRNYESRLTASLTVKKEPSHFKDLDEVIAAGFGISVTGLSSIYEDLKNAKSGVLKRAWEKMKNDPASVVPSDDVGFQKVISESYVYLRAEVIAIPKIQKLNLPAVILKQRYIKMTLHIILPKNSSLTELMSLKILQMRSSGILRKLQKDNIQSFDPDAGKSRPELSVPVQQAIGSFAILCVGVCVAFFCLAIEIICDRCRICEVYRITRIRTI